MYNPAAIMLANLRALFGVIADILLLRRGPEHLPASNLLLVSMILLYAVVDVAVASWSSAMDSRRVVALAINIGTTLLWYHLALAFVGKRERFTQLLTGFFAVSAVFTPIFIPMAATVVAQSEAKEQPSQVFLLLMVGVLVWALTIYVRMIRSAFEWPWPAALLMIIAKEIFTLFVISLILGGPEPAPAQ